MEYFQIPKFHARSDFFNKKDNGRFQKLVKAIEEIGIHKKCGNNINFSSTDKFEISSRLPRIELKKTKVKIG